MSHHFNLETFRGRPADPIIQKKVEEFISQCPGGNTFVFSGINSSSNVNNLIINLKSFQEQKEVRPHFVVFSESFSLLMLRVLYELPDKSINESLYDLRLESPLLLATWYLYRLNAFRGTKIPMARIGDNARLFFGHFIVNFLNRRQMELEKQVIDLINQTKWNYKASKIISILLEE